MSFSIRVCCLICIESSAASFQLPAKRFTGLEVDFYDLDYKSEIVRNDSISHLINITRDPLLICLGRWFTLARFQKPHLKNIYILLSIIESLFWVKRIWTRWTLLCKKATRIKTANLFKGEFQHLNDICQGTKSMIWLSFTNSKCESNNSKAVLKRYLNQKRNWSRDLEVKSQTESWILKNTTPLLTSHSASYTLTKTASAHRTSWKRKFLQF